LEMEKRLFEEEVEEGSGAFLYFHVILRLF
jgi:hypothetical protein